MPWKKCSAPAIVTDALGSGARARKDARTSRRAELVVVAGDEELGLGAGGEEVVAVVAARCSDREAKADQPGDAGIAAAGAQTDVRAEGEAGEDDRLLKRVCKPVDRGADVVDFAPAFIVNAFAQARPAEVEAQHGMPKWVNAFIAW